MSSTDTLGLRWKRPPEWEKFERVAHEIFPVRDSATGYLVEVAWHDFQSDHKAEEIVSRLLEAVGTNSTPREGKKILTRSRDVGDGRTTVRVSPSVKEEMADFADEKDVANYEVLRAVVCYRLDGGALGWVGRQLKKLETRLDLDTDVSLDATMSSKESNTQKIIQGLGGEEIPAFTLEEFNEAVETHPNLKISASKHTRKEYLPRVLDELEFTYHPNPTKDLFVSADEIEIPDVRDPRSKPKAMVREADKRLAVKVDALEELEDVDIEAVPEPALETVVQNKVARARYPDKIDETDTISDEAVERVTDEEIETVIETLGLGNGKPDELAGVDGQLEVLEAGRKAAVTDGGCE